jgi:hypothetical protein
LLIRKAMDFSFCLDKLFDENKIEYVLKIHYAYKLTPRTKNVTPNDAIIVNNCVYYKKRQNVKSDISFYQVSSNFYFSNFQI